MEWDRALLLIDYMYFNPQTIYVEIVREQEMDLYRLDCLTDSRHLINGNGDPLMWFDIDRRELCIRHDGGPIRKIKEGEKVNGNNYYGIEAFHVIKDKNL